MSDFSVLCHVEKRVISISLSHMLDLTVGEAIRTYGKNNGHDADGYAKQAVDAMHASVNGAINYHINERHFVGWDVALDFFEKQLRSHIKECLGNQPDAFQNFVIDESFALAKDFLAPRAPYRN